MTVAATVVTAALRWIDYQHRARRITWLNTLAESLRRRFKRPPWVALQILMFTATLICALFGFIWDVSLRADALIGFPLDDIWRRIFGQGVTLWGPTHLMLIGGAGLSLIAVLFLEYEGRRAMGAQGEAAPPDNRGIKFLRYLSFGGLVVGMSVFQIEYDFGVEQFRLVLQPMLIAAAGALALVARIVLGRGAAIGRAAVYRAARCGDLDCRSGAGRTAELVPRSISVRRSSSKF